MSDRELGMLEPVPILELLDKFADFTIAELVLEIKEGRDALEQEKKAHAVDEFARAKAEQRCEELEQRIHKAGLALSGDIQETEE